jgi:hypothetical protein
MTKYTISATGPSKPGTSLDATEIAACLDYTVKRSEA